MGRIIFSIWLPPSSNVTISEAPAKVGHLVLVPNPTFRTLWHSHAILWSLVSLRSLDLEAVLKGKIRPFQNCLCKTLTQPTQNTMLVSRKSCIARLFYGIETNQILQLDPSSSSWLKPEWSENIKNHAASLKMRSTLGLERRFHLERPTETESDPTSGLVWDTCQLRNGGRTCPHCLNHYYLFLFCQADRVQFI